MLNALWSLLKMRLASWLWLDTNKRYNRTKKASLLFLYRIFIRKTLKSNLLNLGLRHMSEKVYLN